MGRAERAEPRWEDGWGGGGGGVGRAGAGPGPHRVPSWRGACPSSPSGVSPVCSLMGADTPGSPRRAPVLGGAPSTQGVRAPPQSTVHLLTSPLSMAARWRTAPQQSLWGGGRGTWCNLYTAALQLWVSGPLTLLAMTSAPKGVRVGGFPLYQEFQLRNGRCLFMSSLKTAATSMLRGHPSSTHVFPLPLFSKPELTEKSGLALGVFANLFHV